MVHDQNIFALTEHQTSAVTGLSVNQLRAWNKRGFFVPEHAYDGQSVAYSRIYSFRDAVGLRTLYRIRRDHRISIARLVQLAERMEADGIEHWADARIAILKRELHYVKPDSDDLVSSDSGQFAMLPIIDVIREVESKVEELKQRPAEKRGQIEAQRFVVHNSPVIAGTRIPVATIFEFMDAGYSKSDILREFPTLVPEDIDAALQFESKRATSA